MTYEPCPMLLDGDIADAPAVKHQRPVPTLRDVAAETGDRTIQGAFKQI